MIPQEVVLSAICNSVKDDVSAVIAKAEAEYTAMIHKVCHMVLEKSCGRMILLLAGPSASGKTTTAHLKNRAEIPRLFRWIIFIWTGSFPRVFLTVGRIMNQ